MQNQNNLVNRITGFKAFERMNKYRHAAQLKHLLGAVGVHTCTYACRWNYGDVQFSAAHCIVFMGAES